MRLFRQCWLAGLQIFLIGVTSVLAQDRAEKEEAHSPPDYSAALGIASEDAAFFPSRLESCTGEPIASAEYVEPEKCRGCHGTIYKQWSGSMHAAAWTDPLFQATLRLASQETEGFIDNLCVGCHAPVGLISGEATSTGASELSVVAASGVTCDFCHTVSGVRGIGNLPATSEPGDIKRGPFEDSESPFHETQFSETHGSAEFCGLCHDMAHPLSGVQIVGTYSEWLAGPYRKEGVTCQDCHMTPPDPPTAFTANPGKVALNGPQRDHRWTHQFVGGNAMVTTWRDSPLQVEYARKRLEAAAELAITSPSRAIQPGLLEFQVKVSNVGAGHYLPTGMSELRQMWLDVSVTDADGNQLYRSGGLDDGGDIGPEAIVFKTVLGDENGEPTWRLWRATRVLYDHRIPPKGYRTERFAAYVPSEAARPLTLSATLNYRSIAPGLLREMLSDEGLTVPTIVMARSEATVD